MPKTAYQFINSARFQFSNDAYKHAWV